MKIPIPTPVENPAVDRADFNEKLLAIFASINGRANYSTVIECRRYEYVLVDVGIEQMNATAEPIFRFLGVKPEFLPEVIPEPYYGRVGY